ncbi:MAG: hypothetical protein GWP61_01710 [Chloroflexi bacterium]|jgi:hypothetical protein|nr:hypothetical protein [Chloroflexota bacterium]
MKARGVLLLEVILLAIICSMPPVMRAQPDNQAALVIRYTDDDVRTFCVEFDEPQISGYELLQRSSVKLEVGVQGLGTLVCRVDEIGCPANDCLCQCKGGGDCVYWSYWHRLGENWEYSQGGASAYVVEPGAIEGWSWGPGAVNQASPPPDITFDEVCRVPGASPPASAPADSKAESALPLPSFEQNTLDQESGDSPEVDWSPYLFFLMIVLVLGGLLWFVTLRRRSQ